MRFNDFAELLFIIVVIVVVVVIYLTFSVHLWYHLSVARKHGNQEVLSSPRDSPPRHYLGAA